MLVQGQRAAKWHPVQARDEQGGFVRQTASFRNWVTPTALQARPAPRAFGPRPGAVTFTSP
jgi:putative glutathione S-transferase